MTNLTPAQIRDLDEALQQHRLAFSPLAIAEWRVGRTLGTTVYARVGGGDYKKDVCIGQYATPELADHAVTVHNQALEATGIPGRLAWSVDEVAEALNVSRDLVNDMLKSKQIRSVKAGTRRLIPDSALQEYLSGGE